MQDADAPKRARTVAKSIKVDPHPAQETQELLGVLSDLVTKAATRAARGDDVALTLLGIVRDELYTLAADLRDAGKEGGE